VISDWESPALDAALEALQRRRLRRQVNMRAGHVAQVIPTADPTKKWYFGPFEQDAIVSLGNDKPHIRFLTKETDNGE
jgi:hypothetical protein